MKTVSFRECLTGGGHAGTMLRFFILLDEMVMYEKSIKYLAIKENRSETIHSFDLVNSFYEFYQNPKIGEVYNIGGGIYSNCSMLEAIEMLKI